MAKNGDKIEGGVTAQAPSPSAADELAKIAATAKAEAAKADIRYVDRPDCLEAYADSISHLYFDGQSLRIDFSVTRVDDIKPGVSVTGRRYPIQRMVLSPSAAVELMNRLQRVAAALTQAGLLKAATKSSSTELIAFATNWSPRSQGDRIVPPRASHRTSARSYPIE